MGLAPKSGEECEGALELSMADLGTDSTNSIMRSWALFASGQINKNIGQKDAQLA
jgi:hypothetical protein